jgi:uncharacterized membrane protein
MTTRRSKDRILSSTAHGLPYLFLVILGLFWFFVAPFEGVFPLELGLEYLLMMVLIAFTSSMIRWGYSIRGVLFLVIPTVSCLLLRAALSRSAPTCLVAIDAPLLQRLGLITTAYLSVIFIWIYLFPKPVGVARPADPVRDAQWRRLEWAGAVIVAALLLYTMGEIVLGVEGKEILIAVYFVRFAFDVRVLVLYMFFLLLLRAYLHFQPYGSRTPASTAGEDE